MYRFALIASLALAACNTSSSNTDAGADAGSSTSTDAGSSASTVVGTIGGTKIDVQSAFSFQFGIGNDHGQGFQVASIDMTDFVGGCAAQNDDGEVHKNAHTLQLVISTAANPTGPLTTGVYPVGAGIGVPSADAMYTATDANCQAVGDGPSSTASSGSVTVTAISASTITGSYDIVMLATDGSGTKDHVTGVFDAPSCASAVAAVEHTDLGSTNPTCQ